MDNGTGQSGFRQRAANVLARLRLRRREPWNWLVQNLGLCLLAPGLLFHSPALCVLGLLAVLGGVFLTIALPPLDHTELRRLAPPIERLIGLEAAWLAKPLDRRKKWQIAGGCAGALATALFLWLQDLGPIGLAMLVFSLLYIRKKNVEQGIDP